jgi:RNA polymerase sigma-70 factor (ECF subfamily)
MTAKWIADKRLVKRALAGDRSAGEKLVASHYPGVLHFLLHLTGHPNEAEELTQETFVRAWSKLPGFEGRSSFKTWLYQIAYREYAARRSLPETVELDDDLPDDRRDFAGMIVEALAIESAISRLPEVLRITFLICHVQEMSFHEAAVILCVPEGTVFSRLHSAREHLRRQLAMRSIASIGSAYDKSNSSPTEGSQTYEMSKTIV